jgi:hypothetical protein
MAYDLHKKSETLDIDAVVGFGDAFWAALTLFAKRARSGLIVYAVLLAGSSFAAWFTGRDWLSWVVAALLLIAVLAIGFLARITQMDFRSRGGEPLRLRYHVCPSGPRRAAAFYFRRRPKNSMSCRSATSTTTA